MCACGAERPRACSCTCLHSFGAHLRVGGRVAAAHVGRPALVSRRHSLSMTEESWMSRMADASTMLRTMKRLMALSLATSTPDASQRTRFTCFFTKRERAQPLPIWWELRSSHTCRPFVQGQKKDIVAASAWPCAHRTAHPPSPQHWLNPVSLLQCCSYSPVFPRS